MQTANTRWRLTARHLMVVFAAVAWLPTSAMLANGAQDRMQAIRQRAEAFARSGASHEAARRWREASEEYGKAISLNPADPGVTLGYARCLHRLGRHEEAHNALEGAEYVLKDFRLAKDLHRKVHFAWAAVDPRILAIDLELQKKPNDAVLLLQRYRRLQEMQAGELAEVDIQKVLQANPHHAEAHWLRGRHIRFEKGWDAAYADLKAAAELDPQNYTFAREYTRCLNELRRTNEFNREMARVNTLPLPTTAEGWQVLALEIVGYGRYAEAISQIDQAIKLEPANPWHHYHRGKFIRQMNDKNYTAGAAIHLREAQRLAEAQKADRVLQALIQIEFGRVQYAVAVYTQFQSLVIGNNDPKGRNPDGLLPKAVQHFDLAIQLEPHSFGAYIERGMCHFAMQDWDAANADFSVFLASNPQSAQNVAKRTAWWNDVHENWRKGNEMVKRIIDADQEYRRTRQFCTTCGGWWKHGEYHECDWTPTP